MKQPSQHVNGSAAAKPRKPTILIVDDESEIRDVIAELVADEYDSLQAGEAEEALTIARRELPSLVLLDIMMPGKDGVWVCQELRKDPDTRHIPVIMLTAAGQVDNRIRSFSGGADDFIPKPFNADELLVRIDSKIRRFRERRVKSSWASGNLRLSKDEPFAEVNGQKVQLTPVEFGLLKTLLKNANELVTRTQLMKAGWEKEEGEDRLLDAHLTSLRKKLSGFQGGIRAVYGKGYVLNTDSGEPEP